MRVLVTGGAGFIGHHIAVQLLDAGHEVRILDNLVPAAWLGSQPDLDPRAEFVEGDVRDADAVRRCLRDVDAVCHQAAMVGLGVDVNDLPDYVGSNDLGTAVVLAEMARADVARLVFASSMVVYGEGRWQCADDGDVRPPPRAVADLAAGRFEPRCPSCTQPVTWALVEETMPVDPRSVYAATKVAQEHLAAAWQRMTDGVTVGLRYHNVYGARMPRDTPYSGVAAIFRSALERDEPPRVFEDGGQMRDFVHVTDVARVNVLALTAPLEGTVTVNVCSGEPRPLRALAGTLAALRGGPDPVVTGEYRLGDVRHVVASPKLAESVLGFQAAVPFDIGMRQFAQDPLR